LINRFCFAVVAELPEPSEQELADVIHIAAALRAGGAITHGTHLLDG